MAQRADELGGASFSEWFGAMCRQGDVKSPKLHFALIRHGYYCREESVRRWIRGANEPPARAIPALLKALEQALPENVDVWEEFDNWLRGRPFLVASRGSEADVDEGDAQLRGRDSNPQPSGIRAQQQQAGNVLSLNRRRSLPESPTKRFRLVRGDVGELQG